MYEGDAVWESGGIYSAQQPYETAHVPVHQDRGGYGYGKGGYAGGAGGKGGYAGGKGKYQGYQGGRGGHKGKGKAEGKGEGKGYGTPGSGTYGGCFRCARSARWSKHPGAMLHKAADCDAYWQARDPTDLKLHTEDAVYFIVDGEQPQDGDCKHNTQPQSTHLTLRDDRVERVAQREVTYHDEYETRPRHKA